MTIAYGTNISDNKEEIQEEYKTKTKDEKDVIDYLMSIGHNISMIKEENVSTSDFWINGIKVELKSTTSESEDTVYGYFRKAKKQDCQVLILNMNKAQNADLSKAIAWECIKRYKRNHNNILDMSVELWTKAGKFLFESEK